MTRPAALAIAAMLCWGVAYVPSAWLVESWPPLAAAGARLGLGGLALLAVLVATGRSIAPGVEPRVVGWLALTQTVVFYGATFWGIAHAGAGLAAVLANTDPLFVAVLAAIFLGERLGPGQWTGLAVGLVGASLVVWTGPLWTPALSGPALVVVAGAVGWAIGTVVAARGIRGRADPLALGAWQMLTGGIALALVGVLVEEGDWRVGPRELVLVVGLALIGSALPLALFYLALVRGSASEVSAWFFLVPVVGVVTAWPLLGEEPTVRLWVGMAAVCAGLWLVLGRRVRPRGRLVDSSPPP